MSPRHCVPTAAIEIISSSSEEDQPLPSASSALPNIPPVLRGKSHTSQKPGGNGVSGTTAVIVAETGSFRTSAFPASPISTPSEPTALLNVQPTRHSYRGDQHRTLDGQPGDLPHGTAPPKAAALNASAHQFSYTISTPIESSLTQETPVRKSTAQRDTTLNLDDPTTSATFSSVNGRDNLIRSTSQLLLTSQQPSSHRIDDAEGDAMARIS